MEEAHGVLTRLAANIARVIRGQEHALRKLMAAFASGGHVLLEDVPGTGKTTLAKALARSLDTRFTRVQFTPDLLPSDILGVSIYNQKSQEFHFRPGPVFTHILLADEINRASPRTQSALLEAMAEGQVSVEGNLHRLEEPFFVIATQNPVEYHGTYPLPEAQLDRFAMRFGLGYVSAAEEAAILEEQRAVHPLDTLAPVADTSQARQVHGAARAVAITPELRAYIVRLTRATRETPGVKLGAGPRASLALMKSAQALSLLDGRNFVTPEAIRELAVAVLAHRLVLDPQARFAGLTAEKVVTEIMETTPVPG